MDNTYLCHHGVKGMKWGVRKKPEAIGKLGKKTLYAHIGKTSSPYRKANTVVKRISGKDDSVSDRPYVSTNTEDFESYTQYAEMLPSVRKSLAGKNFISKYFGQNIRVDTFTLNKDIKIATGDKVCAKVLKDHGDILATDVASMSLSYDDPLYDEIITKFRSSTVSDMFKSLKDKDPKGKKGYVRDFKSAVMAFASSNRTYMKDLGDYYIKKGYQAIVDPEDYSSGFAKDPLLILDPTVLNKEKSEYLRLYKTKL